MRDLFQRIHENKGPLGKWASQAEGYFVFQNSKAQFLIV
jgi:glycine C-acetyltransferase